MHANNRYDSLFQYYGQLKDVDWLLLKAQAIAESALDPDAKSRVGALGLSQFMPRTWEEWRDGTPGIQPPTDDFDLVDPRDPEDAIRVQAAYMASLLKCFKCHVEHALAAYNWGPGNMLRVVKRGDDWLNAVPSETRAYVVRTLKIFRELNGDAV